MALWRYAVGLLCLLNAVPTTALADVEPSHDLLVGDKMRPPLSPLSPLGPLAVVRSVGANITAPGAACAAEGQWNCLTTCWQRCASGRWSDTMALASGTVCTPAGLSYDMQVVGSGEASASARVRSDTSETGSSLATILSVTTGLCQCTVSSTGCSSSSSITPSSSSTSTTTAGESSSTPSGGEFVSGSSSAAGSGPASAVAVVVGVGTLAVVFARLLM